MEASRVKVLQLRGGSSVVVDVSIRADKAGEDWRSPDDLLHLLHLNVRLMSPASFRCLFKSLSCICA